jgi:hypothetical protein
MACTASRGGPSASAECLSGGASRVRSYTYGLMDPTASAPSIPDSSMSAPTPAATETDPLVTTWFSRIKAAEKRWEKLHKRMRYNRKLVRGIDDDVEPESPKYNKDRANLIQSTITVVLSKVYAKNPEMAAEPTNKARDLRLFADTVSTVTQNMLESAKLKRKAKASVRAAMTCSYGVVKVQYQRDMKTDPVIRQRIEDAQENIARIESLLKDIEDPQHRCDEESKKRELEELLASLKEAPEVVAAEGLVVDRVPSDRLLVDDAVDDIWEYESADWLGEWMPMRKSKVQGLFPEFDLVGAQTFKAGDGETGDAERKRLFAGPAGSDQTDPMLKVYEIWSKTDNRIYTLVAGCSKQFARKPYTPKVCGERWWSYFLLPFQSVDGEFAAQSLVDVLERLQEEHNETRDKFAEVRRNIRPGFVFDANVKDRDIEVRMHPAIGEYIAVKTDAGPLKDVAQERAQLTIDPAVYDTSPIRNDWEMVSGLQDAARSIVTAPKTATEASISDQSLAARVSEFRDQIEDWLTEIAQYASELCLLAMTPAQVETIMGVPGEDGLPVFEWPEQRTPESVFNLVELSIRAGSTAAPNKLQMQENWNKALQLLMPMVEKIRQIDAMGADSTPERELVKETAARFDETIDVERFLPPKPQPVAPMAPAPGMPAGVPPMPAMPEMPGAMPMAGMPMQ